jgi:hypothetical protein
MSNSTSSKIEEAKDHIRDAKNDIKTASQEKTADNFVHLLQPKTGHNKVDMNS